MQGLNQCTLIGNMGSDPQVSTYGERKCATMQICINKVYKKDDEFKTKSTWVRIQYWRDNMDLFTAKKGDTVCVQGELQIDEVEKDGHKFLYPKIIAERIRIMQRAKKDDKQQDQPAHTSPEPADVSPEPTEDLPF